MTNPIANKRIILCVTGSIACYKAADLASKLTQAGAQVDVVLTEGATHFVTPLSFQSVTGRRAYTDQDLWGGEAHVLHVGLGHSTDLIVVAPATANTIAKLAHGTADNLASVTALAANCPLLIAPAMDGGMFRHPATQANLEILRQRRAVIVGPASGHLASGLTGEGRMVEPAEILGTVRWMLGRSGLLAGRKVVVAAGGTQEPIDPVRAITNRSSGKQGYSLAQAALDLGAAVTLISTPTSLPVPVGVVKVDVRTAEEMKTAVLETLDGVDVLLMAAAVADFRPASASAQKIKKSERIPQIMLERTPDILKAVAEQKSTTGWPLVTVGFAAETQELIQNAQQKLEAKKLDLIVANDVTAPEAGFGVDTNQVALIGTDGVAQNLPLLSKSEVAQAVMERVIIMLKGSEQELVHFCTRPDWEAAREAGTFHPESLDQEGFIHCSRPGQILSVANHYYQGISEPLLLWIEPHKVEAEIRWEDSGQDIFPHIYGPLNLDAVTTVTPIEADEDGVYRRLPER